jgi:hypothetical protein
MNRPDLVLSQLGETSKDLIGSYNQAYLKRLKLMGFTEDNLSPRFHIPDVEITPWPPPLSNVDRHLHLRVRAHDSEQPLDRLKVDVNDVPVYGIRGLNLRDKATGMWEQDLDIELGVGRNKVQLSTLNVGGAESLKETFEVTYTGKAARPEPQVSLIVRSGPLRSSNLAHPGC